MDFIQEIIEQQAKKILAKKEEVIMQRLEAIGMKDKIMLAGRFKKIQCEKDGDYERYYIDNGTIEGFLLVTFVIKMKYPELFDDNHIGVIELSYF